MLTPRHLLAKWRPEKHELLHFVAAFWIEMYALNNQEHHLFNV
jgi:hypothetical protein